MSNRWIPVTEKAHPDRDCEVLGTFKSLAGARYVKAIRWRNNAWYILASYAEFELVAWCEAPMPYMD